MRLDSLLDGKSPDKKFVGYLENQAEQFATIGKAPDKDKENEVISGHGEDDTGSGNSEAQSDGN